MKIFVDALSRIPTVSIGTQALIIGCLQILHRRFPGAGFVLLSGQPAQERHYLDALGLDVEIVPRAASQWAALRQLRDILRRVDAVASAWGDGYVGQPAWRLLKKARFLKRRGVPLVLVTASLGPFRPGWDAWCARRGLGLFDALTVRDLNSLRHVQGLGLRNAQGLPDTAFVLDPAPDEAVDALLRREGIPTDVPWVGINASILLHHRFPALHGRPYAETMAELVAHVRRTTQRPVLLIPHQIYPADFDGLTPDIQRSFDGDDRAAADLVLQALPQREGVFALRGEYSPAEYKGVLKRCETFIGGRMHAVIGAVSAGVPSGIMRYSHKAAGTMETLQLLDYVWDCRAPATELLRVASRLWSDRAAIRARLAATMPGIVAQAWQIGDVLAAALPRESKKDRRSGAGPGGAGL